MAKCVSTCRSHAHQIRMCPSQLVCGIQGLLIQHCGNYFACYLLSHFRYYLASCLLLHFGYCFPLPATYYYTSVIILLCLLLPIITFRLLLRLRPIINFRLLLCLILIITFRFLIAAEKLPFAAGFDISPPGVARTQSRDRVTGDAGTEPPAMPVHSPPNPRVHGGIRPRVVLEQAVAHGKVG